MDILYALTADRFTHGLAQHNVCSDWILWALGQIHPAFLVVRSEAAMVARGHSLFCSQSSFVLMSMAAEAGIRARHVGLYGHVVMEAFYDGGWHLYDPDYEVVVRDEAGQVIGVQDLLARRDLLAEAYLGPKSAVIPALLSTQDNTFMSYPGGAWFVWKDQVLYLLERVTRWLKYLLPVVMAGIAIRLMKRKRR